jgi:hypothetical protein
MHPPSKKNGNGGHLIGRSSLSAFQAQTNKNKQKTNSCADDWWGRLQLRAHPRGQTHTHARTHTKRNKEFQPQNKNKTDRSIYAVRCKGPCPFLPSSLSDDRERRRALDQNKTRPDDATTRHITILQNKRTWFVHPQIQIFHRRAPAHALYTSN